MHDIVSVYTLTSHYNTEVSVATLGQNITSTVNGASRRCNMAIAMAHFQSYIGG